MNELDEIINRYKPLFCFKLVMDEIDKNPDLISYLELHNCKSSISRIQYFLITAGSDVGVGTCIYSSNPNSNYHRAKCRLLNYVCYDNVYIYAPQYLATHTYAPPYYEYSNLVNNKIDISLDKIHFLYNNKHKSVRPQNGDSINETYQNAIRKLFNK